MKKFVGLANYQHDIIYDTDIPNETNNTVQFFLTEDLANLVCTHLKWNIDDRLKVEKVTNHVWQIVLPD